MYGAKTGIADDAGQMLSWIDARQGRALGCAVPSDKRVAATQAKNKHLNRAVVSQ